MKIHYLDEYNEELYIAYNKNAVPRIGDTVVINGEDYKVKNVIWSVADDNILVEINQRADSFVKEVADNTTGRLSEMRRAILDLSKRQDKVEKTGRAITEQVTTVRNYINQRMQKERKET